jgi:hypothetical protein
MKGDTVIHETIRRQGRLSPDLGYMLFADPSFVDPILPEVTLRVSDGIDGQAVDVHVTPQFSEEGHGPWYEATINYSSSPKSVGGMLRFVRKLTAATHEAQRIVEWLNSGADIGGLY